MTKANKRGNSNAMPDMEETKEHILAAGRELMLAADGALRFCKAYAETISPEASRSQLTSFFSKAIAVADELGKGLVSASCVKRTAHKAAAPLFEAFGREMLREERSQKAASTTRTRAKKRSSDTSTSHKKPTRKAKRPSARKRA